MFELLLAAAAGAMVPAAKDDLVTYMLGTQPQCARVVHLDTGVDGRPWAWIVGGLPPQWALHVPMQELARGCADARRAPEDPTKAV